MHLGRKRLGSAAAGLALVAVAGLIPAGSASAKPDIASVQARVDSLYRQAEQASEESGEAAQTPEVEAARTALGAAGRLVAKGIDGPETSVPLQYSAPSEDGNAVETRPAGDSTGDAATTGGQGGNRQERRRASKSQHKQR